MVFLSQHCGGDYILLIKCHTPLINVINLSGESCFSTRFSISVQQFLLLDYTFLFLSQDFLYVTSLGCGDISYPLCQVSLITELFLVLRLVAMEYLIECFDIKRSVLCACVCVCCVRVWCVVCVVSVSVCACACGYPVAGTQHKCSKSLLVKL